MFGMLDYRAHKLYRVLVGPIAFLLRLFAIFALPLICYAIAFHFTSNRFLLAILAIVLSFLIAIPWWFVCKLIIAIPEAIFYFLIDVIPADGRTKEEAKLVIWNGEDAIRLIELNQQHPSDWSDETIEFFATRNMNWFFQGKIRNRLTAVREFYADNPDVTPSEFNTERFLADHRIAAPVWEQAITNKIYRGWALSCLFLAGLILFVPPTS